MSPQSEPSQSRPNSATTENASSGSKKRVGRKKATQDGDAVERRRTQLRLAQRAYRERKETTIVDLEKKTANLERALGDMYNIFSDYHDAVAIHQASLNDAKWARGLSHVRKELNLAMRQAGVDPESEKVVERRRARTSASLVPPRSHCEMDQIRRRRAIFSGTNHAPSDTLGYAFEFSPASESTMLDSLDKISTQVLDQPVSAPSLAPHIRVAALFLVRHVWCHVSVWMTLMGHAKNMSYTGDVLFRPAR